MSLDPGTLWGTSDYTRTAERLAPVAPVVLAALDDQLPPPARVLEVGAGHGQLAALLADRGYEVVALEPTERMRRVGSERTGDRVTWVASTAESTGLPSGAFCCVASSFGLMFADPETGVEEVARVLRPGGSLVMTAWAPRGFLHEMTERMATVLPHLAGAPHLSWGDPDVIRERLRPAFQEVTVTEHALRWAFATVADGMELYRRGSPTHVASFAMAGDRRTDLEAELEQHLGEHAGADGAVEAEAHYQLITAQRR